MILVFDLDDTLYEEISYVKSGFKKVSDFMKSEYEIPKYKGVLVPPGGLEALADVSFSVEESMERAFEALDANDDKLAVDNALDAVLGLDPAPAAGGTGAGEDSTGEGSGESILTKLRPGEPPKDAD